SKLLEITKCNAYIDKLMEAEKDYKNVPSINPLFEITILKMTSMIDKSVQSKEREIIREKVANTKFKEAAEPSHKEESPLIEKEEPKKEREIVPSLFDVVYDESKVNSSLLVPKHVKIEDGFYVLNEEQIIEVMVMAKKDIKNQLLDNWEQLATLNLHPELGKKVSLLVDAHPLVATKDILLIEEDLQIKSDKVNQIASQAELQKIVQLVFKKRMFVFALTRRESVNLQQKFINLKQVGKLPKLESINLEFEGR
ncbi:MAG: hypothetical protein WDA35_02535, partial [Bacilli bacterium]